MSGLDENGADDGDSVSGAATFFFWFAVAGITPRFVFEELRWNHQFVAAK